MGPATPFQWALGVPWGGVIYVGASAPLLFEPLARERRGKPLFWGVNVYSAPREVASLVVTRQSREA